MTPEAFTAWVAHMKATRRWSQSECARRLGCGFVQIPRWKQRGAPIYIGLACAALSNNLPPWGSLDEMFRHPGAKSAYVV